VWIFEEEMSIALKLIILYKVICEIFIYMWEYNRKLLNYINTDSICKQLKKKERILLKFFLSNASEAKLEEKLVYTFLWIIISRHCVVGRIVIK